MNVTDFVHRYPRLHHMAEAGAWKAIQQIGLRTTRQLVDDCNPTRRSATPSSADDARHSSP
jgi:hypothetical protein